jgi:hypothetical protein
MRDDASMDAEHLPSGSAEHRESHDGPPQDHPGGVRGECGGSSHNFTKKSESGFTFRFCKTDKGYILSEDCPFCQRKICDLAMSDAIPDPDATAGPWQGTQRKETVPLCREHRWVECEESRCEKSHQVCGTCGVHSTTVKGYSEEGKRVMGLSEDSSARLKWIMENMVYGSDVRAGHSQGVGVKGEVDGPELTEQQAACLRGEHEAEYPGHVYAIQQSKQTSDLRWLNMARPSQFCRHCRCLFVEKP